MIRMVRHNDPSCYARHYHEMKSDVEKFFDVLFHLLGDLREQSGAVA